MDNEIFYSKDLKDIILQICVGVVALEMVIDEAEGNSDKIDDEVMKKIAFIIAENIECCHEIIKKDIGLDELDKI